MAENINEKIDNNQSPGGYINNIIFNNGEHLKINKNDIIIFVGPNNAGKSQTLRDIALLYENSHSNGIVVKQLGIKKSSLESIYSILKNYSISSQVNDYINYSGYNFSLNKYSLQNFENTTDFAASTNLFLSYLNTEKRLGTANPAPLINSNDTKTHPIHYIAFDSECRKKISEAFNKAFNKKLIPNRLHGKDIPLCLDNEISFERLEGIKDEQERLEKYGQLLDKLPTVEKQGDGIRSFCGILLNLVIPHYRTFLIDEPESFLHPPQATIMGRLIGEILSDEKQAFIATHSQEIIKGLVETCPDRIKIIRITREKNSNTFSILDNTTFKTIWNDPLLRYSDIMSGIFYNHVVLCESDSDCKLYSILYNKIKEENNKYSDVLFTHCGGKHRLYKIISALKTLNISVIVVPDIDILNDMTTLQNIVNVIGGDWNIIKKHYTILESNINSVKQPIIRDIVKSSIETILNRSTAKTISASDIKDIQTILSSKSKWSEIKHDGENAIPVGDAKNAYNEIKKYLNSLNVFIVPVGELECFVKEVGGHGPEWVNQVLEKYNDFTDPIYNKIKDFIKSWNV